MKKIAIYGGSFNPPGIHHKEIILSLLSLGIFEYVMVIPCGQRNDKNMVSSDKRREMIELAFSNIPGCIINNLNLDLNIFTSNYRYEKIFGCLGELWHVIGSDLMVNAHKKESLIQKKWENGEWIFNNLNFVVIKRPGFDFKDIDLPFKNTVFSPEIKGSSTDIRNTINMTGVNYEVDGLVLSYIKNNKLYGTN